MPRFTRSRLILSLLSLTVIVGALVGGAVFVRNAQAAPVVTYNGRAITITPNRQPAGTPQDAVFGCQTDRGSDALVCYSPQQMRKAYNIDTLINKGITGKGRTIVIIDAFQNPLMQQDLDAFDAAFGLPAADFTQVAPDGLTPFDPNDDNQVGWAGEIALDVQWAHAIAPAAKIDLVLAKSNDDVDILSATEYAINHNLGDVISQSFGENETCVDPNLLKREHKDFEAATRKNITILASSGDEGAAQQTCDGTSWTQVASSPASDPLVTGVGGTELFAAPDVHCTDSTGATIPCPPPTPAAGTYSSETTLNHPPGFLTEGSFSSGGGYSSLYHRPAYQVGTPNTIAGKRGVPDVAYDAGINHGVIASFLVGGGFFIFGGTSAGSPQWAGLVALADQLGGHRLGFLNSSLYRLGKIPSLYQSAFHDITTGNNTVQEPDANDVLVPVQGFDAKTNWDAATGLGSPKATTLLPLLIAFDYLSDGLDTITDMQHGGH